MLAVLATPLAAQAQPAGKVIRIGMLCATRCEGPGLDQLREGLRDLGWTEGNLVIETRGAGGQLDRLPSLARELVALNPALIVASSPQPSRAAKDATSVIPIVFVGVADPVRVGLVQSLARPGGNVTGVATLVPGGFMAKQLELLKEAVPRASRVATLGNPKNDVYVFAPLLGSAVVQRMLKAGVRAGPAGPTDAERARGASHVWGEVTDAAGRRAVSRLRTPEGYTLTALAALEITARVIGGAAPIGYQMPASAYGPDLILSIPGCERSDDPIA